jgi:hypothetical protein
MLSNRFFVLPYHIVFSCPVLGLQRWKNGLYATITFDVLKAEWYSLAPGISMLPKDNGPAFTDMQFFKRILGTGIVLRKQLTALDACDSCRLKSL